MMTPFICRTCGVQYSPSVTPPDRCIICNDDRQYVGWDGQQWTTLVELGSEGRRSEVREEEPGLFGIGVEPPIGIGQRSILVTGPDGNLLWDVPGFVDESAMDTVDRLGGLIGVSASHPHFYGVISEWADRFDVPVILPEVDRRWITRAPRRLELYGDRFEVTPTISLVRCGGHFPGSAVAHWTGAADGAGVLLSGDSVTVAADRSWVSFMWSYPNMIPLDERELDGIESALASLRFERIYGGWWGRVVAADGEEVVRRSLQRYRTAITDTRALEPAPDEG